MQTNNKKVLAIITARGGSKSIPRKNIKPFFGKPLLAWSAIAAQESRVVDRLIISTDDEEIAQTARSYNVEVPFMRPEELAQDTTPSLPVLQHAVSWLNENEQYKPDYVLLLEPTSPARQAFHISDAVQMALARGADSVISLGEVPGHFNMRWQVSMDNDGSAQLVDGTPWSQVITRRQDLPLTHFRNGVFYLFKTELLFANEPSLYGEKVYGYPVEAKYSIDIDNPEDWVMAERLFAELGL
ncbi:MAG: acylneuraminate cytidylyltransferase family protein [bacterium]|nr:acylneuraminate cytidylyltransferase family protein [bacterium]